MRPGFRHFAPKLRNRRCCVFQIAVCQLQPIANDAQIAALLVGTGFRSLRIRTPWLASKYGAENATTFARAGVIVTSSSAKSTADEECADRQSLPARQRDLASNFWTHSHNPAHRASQNAGSVAFVIIADLA